MTLVLASPSQGQWVGGLKAGLGQGGFSGTTEFEWQSGAATIAAFANSPITRWLDLQIEAYATEKEGLSRVTGSDLTLRADYLRIPVMARFAPNVPGAIKPYFVAGPSLVLELRCKVRFVTVGLVSINDCNDQPSDLNRTDVGVDGGVGFELRIGPANLLVEARGNTNLGTVVVPTETRESRSYSWTVLTGFSIPFHRRGSGGGSIPRAPVPVERQPVVVPISRGAGQLPELPALPVEALVEERSAPPRVENAGNRISVRAIDADARALLVGIAHQAGINIVVSSDVNRRVSLNLVDVTAEQAINEIAIAADLTVARPENRMLPSVVYYQLPVNINDASAETIVKRFGVSPELARWLVERRKP